MQDWKGNEFRINTEPGSLSQVKGQEIIQQGKLFENFSNVYRACLMKAKFNLTLLADNTFILTAKTTTGVSFILETPKTGQQMTLDGKLNDLRKEIKKLEDFIENGN